MPVQLVPTQHDPPPAQHEPQADVVPSPKPVGHKGIRVDVEERPAWQGNRFIAVLLVLLLARDPSCGLSQFSWLR